MSSSRIIVKRMKKEQISEVVNVYIDCFKGMKGYKTVKKWIECNFKAFPRMQYFVASCNNSLVGYILWIERGGFRKNAVLELEQIGVLSNYRGLRIGSKLVKESLSKMINYLKRRGSKLKLVEVTTGMTNQAQRLYKKTLGAKVECIIRDLFGGDEAIMIARFKK